MAVLVNAGSRRRKRVLSLTSLIDVIFLLLLFFMLSSTFSNYADIDLAVATSGASSSNEPPLLLKLRHDRLQLNGKDTNLTALPNAISSFADEGTKRLVLIYLGPQVNAQQLVDVLVIMGKQTQFSVLVLE